MAKRAAFIASVGIAFAPAGTQAAEPHVLAPISGWTLDFANERCSLIREFADGDARIRLQIDSYGPEVGYRVMLSGNLVARSDAAPIRQFRVGYSPDTHERQAMSMFLGTFGEDHAVSFGPAFLPDAPFADWMPSQQASSAAPRADWPGSAFQRSVTHMTVEFGRGGPFRLDTGAMAAPFAAMRQCIDDLMSSWGIDPAEHRTRSRPPVLIGLPDGYQRIRVDLKDDRPGYTERRYQAIARAQAAESERPVPRAGYAVPVRIMIDATGQPTACVVQLATADEAYRRSVCETWARPYQPALDAEGRPVASFVQIGTDSSAIQVASN